MRSATASIMPVRMFSAHRLAWPSRRVVSTNFTSLMIYLSNDVTAKNVKSAKYSPLNSISCGLRRGVLFKFLFEPCGVDLAAAIFGISYDDFQEWDERIDAAHLKILQCTLGLIGGFLPCARVNDQLG